MLYVFFGKDSFSLRQRLDDLRASLDADGMLASSTSVLDGRRATLAEVTAACDTVPFMCAHRLVIVEGLLSRFGAGRARKRGGEVEAWLPLAGYAERMPPSTHLVLVDTEAEGDGALVAALRGKGEVREFRPLAQRAVNDWIRARAKSTGLELSAAAARLLADFVGNDLWTLSGELEKLSVYAAGHPVGEDDVRALVAAVRETTVFPLVDAIVEGRPAAAIKLLRQMFRQESGPQYILAMIQRQLRHLAVAREMLDAGESGRRIGEALRLRDFALDKLLEQAGRYSQPRLKSAFQRVLEADLQVKRGVYDGELALELLVHDLAAPARQAGAA
ncbi:MAG TPA: DNA polymerase III subunit delta [Dehalococcoidia bacterium]|nr:DNA polymerase III subunit delta [Dehalococcoidia bacterium]